MDIKIRTELKPQYAIVRCSFSYRIDAVLEACLRAYQFAAKEGRHAVLVDLRDVTGEPFTTMERYDAGKYVAELEQGIASGIKFAAVGDEPMIDKLRFAETVARNRGSTGRVFTDIDKAVHWLKEK